MTKVYLISEPTEAVRTYTVRATNRQEAVDKVMAGQAGEGSLSVRGPARALQPGDAEEVWNDSKATECVTCGHPIRTNKVRVADRPGTRVAVHGKCTRCRGIGSDEVATTHCKVCDRRLRDWGTLAKDDPQGVKRGDRSRCSACKGRGWEVLTVDELNETETQWVESNVPADLHWYFGVAND
jgi:hypothetical protein